MKKIEQRLVERAVSIKGVIKRNGKKEKFSPKKLYKSLQNSFRHSHTKEDALDRVVKDIFRELEKRNRNKFVDSSDIKSTVEYVLVKHKLDRVVKHYILYRYM